MGNRAPQHATDTQHWEGRPIVGVVHGQWSIEIRLHWRFHVVMGEEASRIRKDNDTAMIMASIRQLCLNLFEREKTPMSLAKKHRKAA